MTSRRIIATSVALATALTISAMATSCSDCQRLNGSSSCRARNSWSSWLRFDLMRTGAENCLKSEGTGRLGGLDDDPNESPLDAVGEFDDVASRAADEDDQ